MLNQNLIRCMIYALTEENAIEYGKYFFKSDPVKGYWTENYKNYEIKTIYSWPTAPKGLPEFTSIDVLFIRIKNESDWISLAEYIHEHSLIRLKIIITDVESKLIEEIKPNICCKPNEKTKEDLFNEIIKSEIEMEEVLKNVFNNFDKNGDGSIDMQEIEQVCRELGIDTTKTDFQDTLRTIDINNDNKITFNEFCDWWKQGRQKSKLMSTLVTLRLQTSNLLHNLSNNAYINNIKEAIHLEELEKKELVNSYLSINVAKVKIPPEATIGLNLYLGGEKQKNIAMSFIKNIETGLKCSNYFIIFEFELKEESKMEVMLNNFKIIINNLRDSLKYISRPFAEFINNELNIMVFKKNNNTICLSCKLRRKIKEQLLYFQNFIKTFVDDVITQYISLSFMLSGNVENVKNNPNKIFIDAFDPGMSLEIKSEILKRNIKNLLTYFENYIPINWKLYLHSYAGSRNEFNFDLNYIKTLTNSPFNFPSNNITAFLKVKLINLLKDFLAPFGGFNQYKIFYDAIKENLNVIINTPQLFINAKIEINDITKMID